MVGGFQADTLDFTALTQEETATSEVNGLALHLITECDTTKVVCSGAYDASDPVNRVGAHALLYLTGKIIADKLRLAVSAQRSMVVNRQELAELVVGRLRGAVEDDVEDRFGPAGHAPAAGLVVTDATGDDAGAQALQGDVLPGDQRLPGEPVAERHARSGGFGRPSVRKRLAPIFRLTFFEFVDGAHILKLYILLISNHYQFPGGIIDLV